MRTPRGLILGYHHRRKVVENQLMPCLTRPLDGHELAFETPTRFPESYHLPTFNHVAFGVGSMAIVLTGVFANARQTYASLNRAIAEQTPERLAKIVELRRPEVPVAANHIQIVIDDAGAKKLASANLLLYRFKQRLLCGIQNQLS